MISGLLPDCTAAVECSMVLALVFISIFATSNEVKKIEMCDQRQLKSAACWALCRQDEFDTGYYVEKEDNCWCVSKRRFRDASAVKLSIPRAPEQKQEQRFGY